MHRKKFLEMPIHHRIFFLTASLSALSVCIFTGLFYAQKAFTSPSDFRMPPNPFHIKGETSGIGTHFAITDSEYLNVTLESDETIALRLTSIPKVLTMMFAPATTTSATTTQIILSGLVKNTTYYKYEDDYHNLSTFSSNTEGMYHYLQDISKPHVLFIQTRPSTKFIAGNAVGGDCPAIGNWNPTTKTCTITTDVNETVQIDSDNITVDGDGRTINGGNTIGTGVYAVGKNGITIKNFHIRQTGTGIFLYYGSGNTVEDNDLKDNNTGLMITGNNDTSHQIKNNAIEGPGSIGISSFDSDYNFYSGNTITGFQTGLFFSYCSMENDFTENTFQNNELIGFTEGSSLLFSRNNFLNNTSTFLHAYTGCGHGREYLFKPLPQGGNYWSTNNSCSDANNDNICDSEYFVASAFDNHTGEQIDLFDEFPWGSQDRWKGTVPAPTLMDVTTTEDDYLQDEKGVADKTNFTFSVVYTDPSGATTSPQIRLALTGPHGSNSLAITRDTSTTTPTELHDGNFTNGELFARTMTFPKGVYTYHYEANEGAERFPSTGELSFMTGYSNVAFIPGLEASQLFWSYAGGAQQLWLPGMSSHVKNLYLSRTTGESLNPSIYVSGVVNNAYGVSIYQGFLDRMEEMKASGDIEQFETFIYDWRKFQTDVTTQLVSTGTNGEFYSMIERVKEMADASPTGKVTLITHSNGGLVAKELTDALKQQDRANGIEKIIMVAAPELGTPKAILEMLHGAEPFVLGTPNKEVTRELAENMKSAYSLLPSREYFNRLSTPIRPLVEFSTTTSATLSFRNIYGNSISDYDTLRKFLRGENGLRSEPAPSVTNEPNVLKENFLADAESLHSRQDNWTPPIGIEVIQIIGWGLDTPHGILYTKASKQKTVCNANLSVCTKTDVIDPRPLNTTVEGDGTVQYVSAEAMAGGEYYIDIEEHNSWGQFNINRDHKNILEIASIQTLLSTLVKNQSTSTLPQYITNTKPFESLTDKRLRIGAFSPVSLHLYDSLGRHTGIAPNSDTSSDLEYIEEQIPNSYYWKIGEGQYTGVGADTITTIVLKGKETGTFTLEIQEVVVGENTTTTVFQNIPTTASTTATVQAGGGATSVLSIDIDGNGTIDAEFSANTDGIISDPLAYISLMKKTVISFSLQKQTEKQLLSDMEQIERTLERFIKFDDITKKIFDKFSQKIRNEKIRDKWKEWRKKHLARRDKIEDKLLLTLIENTEKDVTRFMKQKKISIDQADILFTMLSELKTLVK